MVVAVVQLDGKLPNLALMRITAHHRHLGDDVRLYRAGSVTTLRQRSFEAGIMAADQVYASAIFERTRPLALELRESRPDAVIGGTGWEIALTLADVGIGDVTPDYEIYPSYPHSLGFTQRGCRLRCGFCVVPRKEGAVRPESSIAEIWRGDPWPRHVVLLDNDFFGQPAWRGRVRELREGGFKVSFNQGINARMLTDEAAEAIASLAYYDDDFRERRIYTAWDNRKDEARLFRGLEALVRYGVKPDHIMVYMLIGYWPGETAADREYRRAQLRAFGCRPYPMPFVRTPELVGFQRWVIGAYDKRVTWAEWEAGRYEPRRMHLWDDGQSAFAFGRGT